MEQSGNLRHNGLWVIKGRLGVGMNVELPFLMPRTNAAELIMINAHNQHLRSANDTLWRSCSSAWITSGKKLAERVSNNCYMCRRRRALAKKQKLADLPRERLMNCKPIKNIQVDLARDIKVKAMCKSRATLKTYPVICMNTGAMNIRLMQA